jgi:hypothetical protein
LSQSEKFFKAASIDLTKDDPVGPQLSDRIAQLEAAFRIRNASDNLVLARLREELDAGTNKLKEDRVIINGWSARTPSPRR